MNQAIMDDLVRQAFGQPMRKSAAPWGKILGGVGAALGLGAYGAAHASNHAAANPGFHLANPLTWGGGYTRQQSFDAAKSRFDAQNSAANTAIDQAMLRGEHGYPEADRIQGQLADRSYGGGMSLWGLNPWAAPSMAENQGTARGIQNQDRGQLERLRARMAQRQGQMSPDVQSAMDEQMRAMSGRVNQDWTAAPGGPTANPQASGSPIFHQRPMSPSDMGRYLNPHDYQQHPQPTQVPWLDLASSSPTNHP